MGWNEESTDAEQLQETMKNLEVWILVSSSYGTRAQHALLQCADYPPLAGTQRENVGRAGPRGLGKNALSLQDSGHVGRLYVMWVV